MGIKRGNCHCSNTTRRLSATPSWRDELARPSIQYAPGGTPPSAQRHISSLQINVLQTTDGADRTLARKQSALPPPARSSRPHVMLPCWIVLRCWSVGVVSLFCWICTARHDTTVKTRLVLMSTTIDRKWKLHVPVPREEFHHIDGNSDLLVSNLYRHASL